MGGAQAQRLAADLGSGVEALTLDAFVWRIGHDRLRLSPSDVVALDEAGQVDTRRWAAFADAIGAGPTVVALGDHAQLSPICRRRTVAAPGDGQGRSSLRCAGRRWNGSGRRGRTCGGARAPMPWRLYAKRGHLELHGTPEEALDAAVAAWDRDGRDGLIVTLTSNAERHRANLRAQAMRRLRGDVGGESVSATGWKRTGRVPRRRPGALHEAVPERLTWTGEWRTAPPVR